MRHNQICDSMTYKKVRETTTKGRVVSAALRRSKQMITRGDVDRLHKLQCSICNQQFSRKKILLRHIKSKHENQQFKCVYCGMSWCRKSQLNKHSCVQNHQCPLAQWQVLNQVQPSPRVLGHIKMSFAKVPKLNHLLSKPCCRLHLEKLGIFCRKREFSIQLKRRKKLKWALHLLETSAAVLIGDRVKKERIQKRVSRELFVSKLEKKAHKSQVRINLIVGNDAAIHDVQRKIRCLKIPEEWLIIGVLMAATLQLIQPKIKFEKELEWKYTWKISDIYVCRLIEKSTRISDTKTKI